MRKFSTKDAACPRCRERHGKPLPADAAYHIGRIQMGHQMYHTEEGRVAACTIPIGRDEDEVETDSHGVGPVPRTSFEVEFPVEDTGFMEVWEEDPEGDHLYPRWRGTLTAHSAYLGMWSVGLRGKARWTKRHYDRPPTIREWWFHIDEEGYVLEVE